MKNLPEGAGSPISRMPQTTEGGLQPTHQPIFWCTQQKISKSQYAKRKSQHTKEGVSVMSTETQTALQYWRSELANKEEGTKQRYQEYFNEFLTFVGKTPDELIVQRQQDLLNPDRKIQRRIESLLLAFLAKKKAEGYAVATRQIYFASIRSFFEIHYFPLIMRKGDYPTGDSNGVKRATKEAILKALNNPHQRNKPTVKAIMLFIKDSGLRVSDVRRLNYGDIAKQLEKGETLIQINVITEKTNLLAKAFIEYDLKVEKFQGNADFWNFIGNPIYRNSEKSIAERCRASEEYRKLLFEKIDLLVNCLRSDRELLRKRRETGKRVRA